MGKVQINLRRTTAYPTAATLKKGDYFHYLLTENRAIDGSGIMLCITDGKECVNLYSGDVCDILVDWPVELVKNVMIQGDI